MIRRVLSLRPTATSLTKRLASRECGDQLLSLLLSKTIWIRRKLMPCCANQHASVFASSQAMRGVLLMVVTRSRELARKKGRQSLTFVSLCPSPQSLRVLGGLAAESSVRTEKQMCGDGDCPLLPSGREAEDTCPPPEEEPAGEQHVHHALRKMLRSDGFAKNILKACRLTHVVICRQRQSFTTHAKFVEWPIA